MYKIQLFESIVFFPLIATEGNPHKSIRVIAGIIYPFWFIATSPIWFSIFVFTVLNEFFEEI